MYLVACDNCDWQGDDEDEGFTPLHDCVNLVERLEPGSEVPAGDCPECRCFCYLVKDTPCKVCGKTDGPLPTSGVCGNCFAP